MIVSSTNILSLIPQRPPFVMIGCLLHYDEIITRTGFTIDEENIFTANGKFTEPGLVENIAQTAAARAGYIAKLQFKPVQVGYIGSLKNLEIYNLPAVNDDLVTEVTMENQIFEVSIIKGKIWCRNVLMVQCENVLSNSFGFGGNCSSLIFSKL